MVEHKHRQNNEFFIMEHNVLLMHVLAVSKCLEFSEPIWQQDHINESPLTVLEVQHPSSADLNPLDIYVQENLNPFFLNNQPDALIIPILFCYKTLHVSVIFSAHHQQFSNVHSALVSFIQVSDDRFQAESGWNAVPSWLCLEAVIRNLPET